MMRLSKSIKRNKISLLITALFALFENNHEFFFFSCSKSVLICNVDQGDDCASCLMFSEVTWCLAYSACVSYWEYCLISAS